MENLLVDLAMQGLEEAAGKWDGAGDANGKGVGQGRYCAGTAHYGKSLRSMGWV